MNNAVYWIWLQQRLGCASTRTASVISREGSAREIFELGEEGLVKLGIFTKRQIQHLCDKDLSVVQDILTKCGEMGYSILTPDDEDYPDRLKHISSPPAVLYMRGKLPDPEYKMYAGIVGAREPTDRGADAAYTLSLGLAQAGAVIVSGGARGIDSAAHMGALAANGKTVAVLGCGLDYEYNMSKRSMREMIASKGAVVSEYPPATPAVGRHFPERNRIISGLSHAVIVAQAGSKSGALITAKCAGEQGREVFAVEDSADTAGYEGTLHLLENGAHPVSSAGDVISMFENKFCETLRKPTVTSDFDGGIRAMPGKGSQKNAAQALAENTSEDAQAIYSFLENEGQQNIDDIVRATKIVAGSAFRALTELELLGIINALPGRRYEIK